MPSKVTLNAVKLSCALPTFMYTHAVIGAYLVGIELLLDQMSLSNIN